MSKIAILGQNQPWLSLKPQLGFKKFISVTPPKLGFLRPNKVLGVKKSFQGPLKMKKTVFLNNPPSKKVVTHVPIFRLAIVSPLHWLFVRDILFSLTLLQEGCVKAVDNFFPMYLGFDDLRNYLLQTSLKIKFYIKFMIHSYCKPYFRIWKKVLKSATTAWFTIKPHILEVQFKMKYFLFIENVNKEGFK